MNDIKPILILDEQTMCHDKKVKRKKFIEKWCIPDMCVCVCTSACICVPHAHGVW